MFVVLSYDLYPVKESIFNKATTTTKLHAEEQEELYFNKKFKEISDL